MRSLTWSWYWPSIAVGRCALGCIPSRIAAQRNVGDCFSFKNRQLADRCRGREQVLRVATFLTFGCLFIPLLVSLCQVYNCAAGGLWLTTSLACFSSAHVLLLVAITISVVVFAVAAVVRT